MCHQLKAQMHKLKEGNACLQMLSSSPALAKVKVRNAHAAVSSFFLPHSTETTRRTFFLLFLRIKTPFPVQKTCRNIGTACYLAATIYNIQDNLDLLFSFHLLYLRREFRMQFYLWLQLWAEKKHIVSSLPEGSFATNEHVGLQSF